MPISNAYDHRAHALAALHDVKTRSRDCADEKSGVVEEFRWVPIFLDVDERRDGTGKRAMGNEEEPVYCDCEGVKTGFDRDFDLRALTIREESYGEV